LLPDITQGGGGAEPLPPMPSQPVGEVYIHQDDLLVCETPTAAAFYYLLLSALIAKCNHSHVGASIDGMLCAVWPELMKNAALLRTINEPFSQTFLIMTFRALQTDPTMDLREMLHRISDFSATLRTSYTTDGVEFADHNEVEECGQNARKLWSLVCPLLSFSILGRAPRSTKMQ
jgi:hypothetical protein